MSTSAAVVVDHIFEENMTSAANDEFWAVNMLADNKQPKLRRSNGEEDLRTLYLCSATSAPLPEPVQLSFEEQLTLAILAEMQRAPHRFGMRPPPGRPARLSQLLPIKTALSNFGTLLRSLGPPVARVF